MSDYNSGGGDATITGTVKWFNAEKGYGFVAPSDGSPDVFLHISALKRANLDDAPQGSTIVCQVQQGQKGRQVSQVSELDTSTAEPSAPRRSTNFGDRPRPPGDRGGFGDRDRGGYGEQPRPYGGDRGNDRGGYGEQPRNFGDRGGYGDRAGPSDRGGFGDRGAPADRDRSGFGDKGGFGDRGRGGFNDRDRGGKGRGSRSRYDD